MTEYNCQSPKFALSQLLDNDKAKSIVGEDLYNQLKKESDSFGGIDYGLAEKTAPTTQKSTVNNPDSSSGIEEYVPRQTQFGVDLPIQTPDQSNSAPAV